MDTLLSPNTPELNQDDILELAAIAKALGKARSIRRARMMSGSIVSKKRGHGLELHEIRPYDVSDEARHMDWRVTAKTGIAHTRVYTEDVEHRTLVLLSLSPDAYFGTQTTFISTRLAQLAAIIAWRSYAQRENVGFVSQTDNEFSITPNIRDWRFFSEQLAQTTLIKQRTLQPTSYEMPNLSRFKGYSVIVLSDHIAMDEINKAHLQQLAQHNRVHWVSVEDASAFSLPNGHYQFANQETKNTLHISSAQRSAAKQHFAQLAQQHDSLMTQLGVGYYVFDVNHSPIAVASELLARGILH
ncbi:MAG: DUF58 domain-containing protein [Marinomonas atlantica]|nr:DUF58 domain-containing protein [Marinomonas atlantica]